MRLRRPVISHHMKVLHEAGPVTPGPGGPIYRRKAGHPVSQ